MKFSGELKFPEIDHPGVPVQFMIEGSQAELLVDGESLGRWSLYDIHARRLVASAFQIDLDGTEVTFVADDPIDFAYRGVEHMAETWAKIKSKGIATRSLAVRKTRKGTTPSRIEDMKAAMVSNLETQGAARHIAGQQAMPEEAPATGAEPGSITGAGSVAEPAFSPAEPETLADDLAEERARLEEERQKFAEERARFEEERRIAEQREADRIEAYRIEMKRLEAEREALRQQAEQEGIGVPEPSRDSIEEVPPEVETVSSFTEPGSGPDLEPEPELAESVAGVEEPVAEEEVPEPELEVPVAEVEEPVAEEEVPEPEVEEPVAEEEVPEPDVEEPVAEEEVPEPEVEEPVAEEEVPEPEVEEPVAEEEVAEPSVVDLSDLEETGGPLPDAPEPVAPGPVGRNEPEPAMAGATKERGGLMGAVRAAFRSGSRDHEHQFVEAPGGIGITRYVCEECGYVSISV